MAINPLLKRIADAQATQGGNWIKDGAYIFTIVALRAEAKNNGACFIVELEVDESEDVPGQYEKGGRPVWPDEPGAVLVKANPKGSRCSYVLNLDSNKSAAGNAKAFVQALLGVEEVTDMNDFLNTLDELVSKAQPARGMQIGDATFRKKIRQGENAGKPFVGHNWQNIDLDSDAIAARRARLDKSEEKKAA